MRGWVLMLAAAALFGVAAAIDLAEAGFEWASALKLLAALCLAGFAFQQRKVA